MNKNLEAKELIQYWAGQGKTSAKRLLTMLELEPMRERQPKEAKKQSPATTIKNPSDEIMRDIAKDLIKDGMPYSRCYFCNVIQLNCNLKDFTGLSGNYQVCEICFDALKEENLT